MLAAAGGVTAVGTALSQSSQKKLGNLFGGTMGLNEAYNVSGDLWIGPDSAKGDVAAESGRVYMAVDTQVEYYGTGDSWDGMGLGSASNPVSEIHSESVSTEEAVTARHKRLGSVTTTPSYWGPDLQLDNVYQTFDSQHVKGRLIGKYYWSDPPYGTENAGVDSYDPDDGANNNGVAMDGDATPCLVADDSIFVFKDKDETNGLPVRIYRAPDYQTTFDNSGTLQYERVLDFDDGGATMIGKGGRFNYQISAHPDSGTIVVGEYNQTEGADPKLYRSTDNGQTWSVVYQETGVPDHVHSVAPDPYEPDHWIVCLGDNGEDRYLESWDDGATWSREPLGFDPKTHAVGIDYGPDYIYFAQDQGSGSYHGPWVVRREDREMFSLCSTNPRFKYRGVVDGMIELGLIHDRAHGITYIRGRDGTNGTNYVYYVDGIGGEPQMIDDAWGSPQMHPVDGYISSAQGKMYARLSPVPANKL
ncbi:WD40/YVTN/BNR-like repeat-containing protein [Haloterrigena turkmenica]|uniref:WD40/YVTN/BNR-like repeat-containing protein n=1 Tax=Haloterrigena turkmenica TaxID=62320 RepID=UPI0011D155BA|nr:glycosyl hydrolase [Haloterrigena turkmenica]